MTRVLKIFGERNSGTNLLWRLLAKNFHVQLLRGTVPRWHMPLAAARLLSKCNASSPRLRERVLDHYFRTRFASTLGWKHGAPDLDRITSWHRRHIRFVIITRNPYAWALSMFRRPYHAHRRFTDIDEFLRFSYPVYTRDNIPASGLPAPALWTAKHNRYLTFLAQIAHGTHIRYEELLEHGTSSLRRIARTLDLEATGPLQMEQRSVKSNDTATLSKYSEYYLSEAWRHHLTNSCVRMINGHLSPQVVADLGYAILDPKDFPDRTLAEDVLPQPPTTRF